MLTYIARKTWQLFRAAVDFPVSNSIAIIDHAHHELHEQQHFSAELGVSSATSFDTNDVLMIAFKTPKSPCRAHMVVLAYSTGAASVDLLEGATVTVETPVGNSVTPIFNRWRTSGVRSRILDTYSAVTGQMTGAETGVGNGPPTVTDNGTSIWNGPRFIGAGQNKIGGESRDLSEWVLAPDTTYVAKLTALAENLSANLGLLWYEHGQGPEEI